MKTLLDKLLKERNNKCKGGIYHKLKADFTFHSDWIEGIQLTREQVVYILWTGAISAECVQVNDIIETVNHFRCFDYILDTISEPLTEEYIKKLHRILKSGILTDYYAVIGEYKKYPNAAGEAVTVMPEEVPERIRGLLSAYDRTMTLHDIAVFHAEYEKIHPFYDGNGRTGRLLMWKQCLENNIVPPVISDRTKSLYYTGLRLCQNEDNSKLLADTLLAAQNEVKAALDYFRIDYKE